MREPQAHIVLKHLGPDEKVPPETEVLRRAGCEFLKNCVIPKKKVDGTKFRAGI